MIKSCEILNALELGFALFSGKNNPTATCLFGQFRKMKPWLSWALPLAHHWHICIFIAPAEFSELTNMNHFTTWVSASGIANLGHPEHPGFSKPSQTEPPTTLGLSCPLWACSNAFLLSLLSRAGLSPGSVSSSPVPQAGGTWGHSECCLSCPAARQTQTGQTKCLPKRMRELSCLSRKLNRQQCPCSQAQVTKASSESLSRWAFPLPPSSASLKSLPC